MPLAQGPSPKTKRRPSKSFSKKCCANAIWQPSLTWPRKGADPKLVERLVKYLDQQMKDHPDESGWRSEKYRLLIAVDRSKELESELRQWVAGPDPENRWRLALGYLLAEQGKVADAIKLIEAVEAADELSPGAYQSLADWYLVENRRDQHEKARAAIYKMSEEHRLSQQINVYLRPWQYNQGHLPTQLDKEVLLVFKVLFEKSAAPQNYLWQLQQFYQASRDFRLLSMLADGVVGHSAGKVYPFLQGMRIVLAEVRDEATADEIVAQIAKVRLSAKTVIDQRALDLLELLVERRAAELQNQPGPHADKALAALARAFKREWSSGEPRSWPTFSPDLATSHKRRSPRNNFGNWKSCTARQRPARSIGSILLTAKPKRSMPIHADQKRRTFFKGLSRSSRTITTASFQPRRTTRWRH